MNIKLIVKFYWIELQMKKVDFLIGYFISNFGLLTSNFWKNELQTCIKYPARC